MATEIIMPKSGMAMEEGVLVRWLKEVGDSVEKDEPIIEIETDKICMESESPVSGTLLAKLVEAGNTVPVFTVLGWIGAPGEKVPEIAAPSQEVTPQTQKPTQKNTISATPYAKKLAAEAGISLQELTAGKTGPLTGSDVKARLRAATPLARNIAQKRGVDLAGMVGSGANGKVCKADFSADIPVAEAYSGNVVESRVKRSGMRRVIGERMYRSQTEIPTVTQNVSADMRALLALREKINSAREKTERISINDFIVKACAMAAAHNPLMRTQLAGDELITMKEAHIAVAVSTPNGLLVPVVRHADKLSLSMLSAAIKDVSARARNGKLLPDETEGHVFTVSNLGMYGVEHFTPIINQPDSAILGVCSIRDVLALEGGAVIEKKMLTMSFTYDHRIFDGATAALVETEIRDLLENPFSILI